MSTIADGPPLGSYCSVEFKRQYLGVAGEQIVSPVPQGSETSVTGTLMQVTREWVVLEIPALKEGDVAQLWIPREVVLLLMASYPRGNV
jgi:hypothetical protein